jgi:arabinogalactan oligomer / maltooligosaccharide transport system substrate-binding protein
VRTARITAVISSLALVLIGFGGVTPAQAAKPKLVIWVDSARAAALQSSVKPTYKGAKIVVVGKEVAAIKAELATVADADAPDLIWADNAWTGELAASATVLPIPMDDAFEAKFPRAVIDGFLFGSDIYAVPVQFENVALITNSALVPNAPTDFATLQKRALRLVKSGKATVGLAVAQGAQGNAYFMQPLYAGLGGYMFGTAATGAVDPAVIGIANDTFKQNAKLIDAWNASGLMRSSVDVAAAEAAFLQGKAPFWITGPWSTPTLSKLTFGYRISPVPTVVSGLPTSPFIGSRGFMVTKWAQTHGVADLAVSFAKTRLARAAVQSALAAGNGAAPRSPALIGAASSRLAQAFATAGKTGIPVPNVPQASLAWGPLGQAWAVSTKGADATPARRAFTKAQNDVVLAAAQ